MPFCGYYSFALAIVYLVADSLYRYIVVGIVIAIAVSVVFIVQIAPSFFLFLFFFKPGGRPESAYGRRADMERGGFLEPSAIPDRGRRGQCVRLLLQG